MKEPKIKPVSLILALIAIFVLLAQSVPKENGKVLIILREGRVSIPTGTIPLSTNEAATMKNMLEEAGFEVVMASVSGQNYRYKDITFKSILKLSDVKINDYVGFVFPCMELSNAIALPEELALAKQVAAEGKTIAAQHKGVQILAEAGVLAGRRYTYTSERSWDERFAGAVYDGNGIVQDGNIITSGRCPSYNPKQTAELIQAFVAVLQK